MSHKGRQRERGTERERERTFEDDGATASVCEGFTEVKFCEVTRPELNTLGQGGLGGGERERDIVSERERKRRRRRRRRSSSLGEKPGISRWLGVGPRGLSCSSFHCVSSPSAKITFQRDDGVAACDYLDAQESHLLLHWHVRVFILIFFVRVVRVRKEQNPSLAKSRRSKVRKQITKLWSLNGLPVRFPLQTLRFLRFLPPHRPFGLLLRQTSSSLFLSLFLSHEKVCPKMKGHSTYYGRK